MTEPTELFVAYGLWHVDLAQSYAASGTTIVCLDFWVEQELKKKNIPCISLREIIDSETGEEEWWALAQQIAREWYRLPAMKFFQYRGISIGEALEPILSMEYLSRLFYYVRIYRALKKKYPEVHVSIPFLVVDDGPNADCLAFLERRAVVDAARVAGLRCTVVTTSAPPFRGAPRAVWKSLVVRVYNALMAFMPPLSSSGGGRRVKIYASEYWSHIGPVAAQMSDMDLVLMDDDELQHIPWRQLLAHRIRTRHPHAEVTEEDKRTAAWVAEEFARQWATAKSDVAAYLASVRAELDWSPVMHAFDYLVSYTPRIMTEIDALRRIMTEERPDVMLQLASVSDRYHQFFLSARVAAELKIPSIELQHASIYTDSRAIFSRIETDYLATYGADTNSWHEQMGHARSRLITIGSPRFDQCIRDRVASFEKGKRLLTQLGLDTARPILFAAVPYGDTSLSALDSYQLADYFRTIRAVQKAVPGMQVLFKCRNYRYVETTRAHLKDLFHTDYAVAGSETVFALLCASDAAVSGNSTLIYEAMLAEKPLVLYPWKSFDRLDARMYEQTAPLVRTETEVTSILTRIFSDNSYRDGLLARQKIFFRKYSFDGKSSARLAAMMRKIARTKMV